MFPGIVTATFLPFRDFQSPVRAPPGAGTQHTPPTTAPPPYVAANLYNKGVDVRFVGPVVVCGSGWWGRR